MVRVCCGGVSRSTLQLLDRVSGVSVGLTGILCSSLDVLLITFLLSAGPLLQVECGEHPGLQSST